MSLVFAALIPHSPMTMPGADGIAAVSQTTAALKDVEGELYVMQPDTLFVISPHAPIANASFSINLSPEFICTYEEFGDDVTSLRLACDIEMISKIRAYADRDAKSPVNIINQSELDHGTSIALYHLTQHLPSVKIVPISLAQLSIEQHYEFGEVLRYVALQSNKRVAIIVSAELSHTLSEDSPHGFKPAGPTFDNMVIDAIQAGDMSRLQTLNLEVAESADAVNEFKTLVMLSGALDNSGVQSKVVSYEMHKGVGLLVAQFNLI